ncbi:MAG: beta-ketoacyl-ACP synthase II [Ignavibacteria bacterium]|nr:beta-ketoacyl-ACP synthase II [Ignavibacteria bacterium]
MKKRVVVTGLGALTPLGLSVEDSWKGLIEGKSGVDFVTYFDTTEFDTKFAAELKGFDPLNYMDRKLSQRIDPFTQYAMVASDMAIADSGLVDGSYNKDRVGVVYGSGIGGMWTYHKQQNILYQRGGNPDRISPFFIPMLIADIAAGRISIKHGLRGPNFATTSACATSANAIIDSMMIIQRGDADVMVTGGSEAVICPMGIGGFNALKALSTRNDAPQKASRPFDKNRDGFVMGEGGATLVIESLEHAKARGARIYCEITGFGMTADAHHITDPSPNGDGVARAMKIALDDSGLKPEDVDVINAHGTSTPPNDRNETAAIKTVFGEHAYKLNVHSIKSMVGHLLGAAGAVESIAAVLTIRDGIIPPTINYEEKDPDCDLNYTANKAVKKDVKTVLSDNSGFGGHNAAIIYKKYEE